MHSHSYLKTAGFLILAVFYHKKENNVDKINNLGIIRQDLFGIF